MTKSAIRRSMDEWAHGKGLRCTEGYCDEPLDNVPWLNPETREEFLQADGNEFGERGQQPKIAALHSSSALAVNVLDYWRHRDKSALSAALGAKGAMIAALRFEQKFPSGIGPRAPNLDVVIEYDNASILAIESKFTEWTAYSGEIPLRDAYLPDGQKLWSAQGLIGAQQAAERYMGAGFRHLDVPQLLKHMLGLAYTRGEKPWTLLLLWHKCDDELAPLMEEEIRRFQGLLGPDSVRFRAMTYQSLWKDLAPRIFKAHAEYVDYISGRYFVHLQIPVCATPQFHSDFDAALLFTTKLHARQTRKGTDIPYISHLVAAAGIVLENGGSRDEAIAALLHDAIEDQGHHYPGGVEALRWDIRTRFGLAVLDIVEGCTDSVGAVKDDWRKRKERYIAHLPEASASVRLVSCADKLHNARAILADLRILGSSLWTRFSGGPDVPWYYRALADEFLHRGPRMLAEELDRTVREIERLAGASPAARLHAEPVVS